MTEAFYPYSRQKAQREGELAQWKRSHQANVKCAQDIKNLIASHARDGQLEPDCARTALDWWGFPRVQFVLSSTLRNASGQEFDPEALHWARTAYVPYEKTNGEFKIQADNALLAQFLRQTYGEYRALGMFGPEHCGGANQNYAGKVLVLRPDRLKEECWSAQNQLWYGECGFGCSPDASGRAVFATSLGDGQKARWDRLDFMGVLDEQHLPDWAMDKLAELRGPIQEQNAPAQEQDSGPTLGGMELG